MGLGAIAVYLNQNGYQKKIRQNNTVETFSSSFIKGVLDNPVYCGKLADGRRKNEKVSGTRNQYHVVKQDTYMLHDGIHEAIISEEDWNLAQKKRKENGVGNEKVHSLEYEHLLSGIIKCPVCNSGMYGNVNRKKRKDGRFLKRIKFNFPVFLDGREVQELDWYNESTVETVVLLSKAID